MLDSFFKISERGSTVGREVRGGLVTFFTMAYIVGSLIGKTPFSSFSVSAGATN